MPRFRFAEPSVRSSAAHRIGAAFFDALEPRVLLSGDPGVVDPPTPGEPAEPPVVVLATDGPRTPAEDPGLIIEAYALIEKGRPIAHLRNDAGDWFRVDLAFAAGFTEFPDAARAEAVVDADARVVHVIVNAGERMFAFLSIAGGRWFGSDLASADDDALLGGDGLTVFSAPESASSVGREDFVYAATNNPDGDLIFYTRIDQLTATLSRTGPWSAQNLSELLRDRGFEAPVFVGELASYVTPWNALTILGVDAEGDVHAVWTAPGLNGQWRTDNLSDISNAPAFASTGLSVFLTDWNGVHIAGFNGDGDMLVTWWLPQFEGRWEWANFTDRLGFTPLQPETMTTYVTPWGGLNIVGVAESGDLTVYWWTPAFLGANDTWRETNLTRFLTTEPGRTPDGPIELTGRLQVGFSPTFIEGFVIEPGQGRGSGDRPLPPEVSIVGADTSGGGGRYAFETQFSTWFAEDMDARAINPFPAP